MPTAANTLGSRISTTAQTRSTETIARQRSRACERQWIAGGRGSAGKRHGYGGGRNDCTSERADEQTARVSQDANGDIAGEGYGRHQHRQEPDLPRIETAPRVHRPVWQQGQNDRGHHRQDQRRTKLDPGQSLQEAVQDLATGKDRRECCPSGSRGPVIAGDGKGAKREHAKARYHCQ